MFKGLLNYCLRNYVIAISNKNKDRSEIDDLVWYFTRGVLLKN